MIFEWIATAIILWLIGGVTPWPIILLAFAEVLHSPRNGLRNGWMYLLFAGLTEFAIGIFLISTSSRLHIPSLLFHGIAIGGAGVLIYLALQIYRIRTIDADVPPQKTGFFHIIVLMLLNWPLWLFWISVCVPAAFRLGEFIQYGEYLFVIIFEIAMVLALSCMLFGFNAWRKYFTNEQIVGKIFVVLACLLSFMALKILYTECIFRYNFVT